MNFEQAEANDASVADEGQGKVARPYVGSLQARLFLSGREKRSHDLE